jgi:hypothetical protein
MNEDEVQYYLFGKDGWEDPVEHYTRNPFYECIINTAVLDAILYIVKEASKYKIPPSFYIIEPQQGRPPPIKTYKQKSNRHGNIHGGWLKRF